MAEIQPSLIAAVGSWWRRHRETAGTARSSLRLIEIMWEFLRDSFPDRRRQRYGDIDYDWECRVDTTSATLSWRTRLMGLLSSPYQPIPPEQFREMMAALSIDFSQFTFIDIGSGKGRALFLASEYPFKRIIGIELLPELHWIAQENVAKFTERSQNRHIELICGDATSFIFPSEPTVLFLFNPLPQQDLVRVIKNLGSSLDRNARPLYVAYANPIHQRTIAACPFLRTLANSSQYSLFYGLGTRESREG